MALVQSVAASVDMRFQPLVGGELAGVVVVEVAHARAGVEQAHDIVAIGMQRDIQHRNLVALARRDAGQERACAAWARHQLSGRWNALRKAKLLQRAEAVRVAVENENARHA